MNILINSKKGRSTGGERIILVVKIRKSKKSEGEEEREYIENGYGNEEQETRNKK